MDFGHLLLWIPGLELAELVHHRESVDRKVSGPMRRHLGGNPHVSCRLHELLRSDGRSLLSGPRGSRHRTGLLPDYRNVLETSGTAPPVSATLDKTLWLHSHKWCKAIRLVLRKLCRSAFRWLGFLRHRPSRLPHRQLEAPVHHPRRRYLGLWPCPPRFSAGLPCKRSIPAAKGARHGCETDAGRQDGCDGLWRV